jgi:hypothetical protein
MKKLWLTACVSFVMAAAPAQAWLEVEGSWWFMKPSGKLALGVNGLEGTSADLQSDLGYGSRIGVPDVKVILGKYVEFGAEYFAFNVSAQNTISRDVRFNDVVYPLNADVATSLDATFVRGFARLNVGPEWLNGGVYGGGQYMAFNAKAASSLVGSTESDVKAGMPYVGGFLEAAPFDWLALRGSACGFKWTFQQVDVKFLDVELSALLTLDWFYAGGGYRYISINGVETDYPITADLKLAGPVVYVGVRW